jgi:glycosyltransferase involved in cell wall biosynthesis
MVTSCRTSYNYHPGKVRVIGQGIDTRKFHRRSDRSAQPLFLSIGRLSPIKDALTAIRAISILRDARVDARLHLIGSAPASSSDYEHLLRREVAAEGLTECVEFTGGIRNAEIPGRLAACAAHVNLCPTGALDKAALEAMACGRPSFVANEGFRECLGKWAPMLMFQHGDAYSLAGKMAELLEMSDERYSAMAADLSNMVVAQHSLERLSERLIEVLDEAQR